MGTSSTTSATSSVARAAVSANTVPASYLAIAAGSTATVGSWLADTDYTFTGWGEAATYTSPINTSLVSNPPPQSVYQTDRWAPTITYTIPNMTPNGAYTVRLHFAECWFNSAGQRLFNVSINGAQVLTNFDVFQAAGGENIAIAKSYAAHADANGNITIFLSASVNNALISGIEITGTSSAPTPVNAGIAISAGNPKAIGNWVADTDYTTTAPGAAQTFSGPVSTQLIASPAPQAVYQSERWAKTITYTIPKLTPNAAYTVRLSFVEAYFSSVGKRLINVSVNGTQVLANFDIFKSAGRSYMEIAKSFPSNASSSGTITIGLSATVNDPVISGVEVIAAASTASPTPAPITSPTPAPSPTTVGSVSYPHAGWVPYTKGPMITTVASMYGSSPLSSCKVSGGAGGSCLASTSSGTIANLWANNPSLFNVLYVTLGGTAVYQAHYNGSGDTNPAYFQSTSSDPLYNVQSCSQYPTTCDTGSVHIPAGAVPETGADHHLYIHDTSTGQDWSNWGSPIPSGNGGNFQANTSNVEYVGSTTYASEGLGLQGTAGNISMAWGERPEDILAGRIPHALSLRNTCDTSGGPNGGAFEYPVVPGTQDNNATDNGNYCGSWSGQFTPGTGNSVNLEYGAHLWLDTPPSSSQRGQSGCDIVAYAELRALNEFGGYVNDVGSAGSFGNAPIYVNRFPDISDTYTGNPNGTASSWAQVAAQIGEPSGSGSQWSFSVGTCGINLASHLHVLIPPTAN